MGGACRYAIGCVVCPDDPDVPDESGNLLDVFAFPADRLTRRWSLWILESRSSPSQYMRLLTKARVETLMLKRLAGSPIFIESLTGVFITVCGTALMTPDKDPENSRSYRPTCLLPFLGKVLERLMRRAVPSFGLCVVAAVWLSYGKIYGRRYI